MKIKNIFILIFVFTSLALMSQQTASNKLFYGRFEGVIGENIHITANIIRLFDKISGNYQYRFINEDNEMHFGKTINIDGNVNLDNTDLKEFGQDAFTFSGVLNEESYKGTWKTPDDKELDFSMKAYYPIGTLPFDIFYLHSEDKLVSDNTKSPIAEIELTLIFPENKYFQAGIVDSVKHIIANSFFGKDFYNPKPDSMLTHFETEYFNTYKKQNADWFTNGASFNWQKMISMSIIYNSNYLLCVEYLKYAYSGGAHGMTNIAYDIINLNAGSSLSYKDIFKEDTYDSLTVILTQKLRKDYSIPNNVSLKDAGFFVENIEPNHNIYISGNGIGFLYNSYEIAPYSTGQTNVFLEFDEIKGLLNSDTPVSMMSDR
jgi:hypothetical protein